MMETNLIKLLNVMVLNHIPQQLARWKTQICVEDHREEKHLGQDFNEW